MELFNDFRLEETSTTFILRKKNAEIIEQIQQEHQVKKSLVLNTIIALGIEQYLASQ